MAEKSAAIKKIESLKEQIAKETESVKVQLAKELNTACDTFKLLEELGVTNVLRDPMYHEFVNVLNIDTTNGAQPARSGGQRAKRGEMKEAVLSVLQSGHAMSHKDLKAGMEKLLGRQLAGQFILLDKLVKDKTLVKTGEGKQSTYKIAK